MPELKPMQLTPEMVEKETVLSCMIERMHNEPSAKNMESLLGALKGSFVYVPVKIMIDPSQSAAVQKAAREGNIAALGGKVRFAPLLMVNNTTKEKILPVFSREEEYHDEKSAEKIPTYLRIPIENIIELADNMPEAFDFGFDIRTHAVRMTLDQLEIGLGMAEAPSDEEEGEEGAEA